MIGNANELFIRSINMRNISENATYDACHNIIFIILAACTFCLDITAN